jgi:hypothetical protein
MELRMMRQLARSGLLLAVLAVAPAAMPQQQTTQPNGNQTTQSLGEAARQQRALKEQQARTAGNDSTNGSQGTKSVADAAREQKEKRQQEIRTTLEDSRKLFASIDEVLDFASHDSGLTKRNEVKHQLISENDVIHNMAQNLSDSTAAQRLARSEVVLKKFGFLPPNFDLKTFLVTAAPKAYLAYYDPKTKMVNLLNWVDISEQLPILSHELTHALQDQNYDLLKWRGYNPQRLAEPPKMRVDSDDEQESGARTAVVEGQAEIVRYDYMLKPLDRTLANTPEFMDLLQEATTRTYDDMVSVHNAPLLLKETGIFPYREGLNFELELLRTGGKQMAFAGAFARPPRDTHDILEPQAYIAGQKKPASLMPDVTVLLADKYEAYDSGTIGQLDVRTMAKQFGREDDAFSLTPNWQGGAYVAVKRLPATGDKAVAVAASDKPPAPADKQTPAPAVTNDKPNLAAASDKQAQPAGGDKPTASAEKPAQPSTDKPAQVAASDKPAAAGITAPNVAGSKPAQITTRELALLYVSRWKTIDAAQRFLDIYKNSLSRRVTVLDTKTSAPANCSNDSPTCGPLWATRVMTDEGPVYLEIWPRNLVFISQSFDEVTVNRLRQAVLHYTPNSKTQSAKADLSLRLFELPEFQGFQEEVGREINSALLQHLLNSK